MHRSLLVLTVVLLKDEVATNINASDFTKILFFIDVFVNFVVLKVFTAIEQVAFSTRFLYSTITPLYALCFVVLTFTVDAVDFYQSKLLGLYFIVVEPTRLFVAAKLIDIAS